MGRSWRNTGPTTVVVFASDRMGEGDPELGAILMRAFCQTMVQMETPKKLLFYNRGVFLTLNDSSVLSESATMTSYLGYRWVKIERSARSKSGPEL